MNIKVPVARVLSGSEVALSAGSERGIRAGDRVEVFEQIEIRDPHSGTILGSVEKSRMILEIKDVHPLFSVARVAPKAYNPFAGFSMFGAQDKFITGRDVSKDEFVNLNPGDEVMVYLSDSSDVPDS